MCVGALFALSEFWGSAEITNMPKNCGKWGGVR